MACSCPRSFIKQSKPTTRCCKNTTLPHLVEDIRARAMNNSVDCFQPWTWKDQIEFNRYLIDECEVTCMWADEWGLCNKRVKGKDLKSHLSHGHAIASDSQLYQCLWQGSGCSPEAMQRGSLIRHVKEQHVPVKWACFHCDQTFTREGTMMAHIRRSAGPLDPAFEE